MIRKTFRLVLDTQLTSILLFWEEKKIQYDCQAAQNKPLKITKLHVVSK